MTTQSTGLSAGAARGFLEGKDLGQPEENKTFWWLWDVLEQKKLGYIAKGSGNSPSDGRAQDFRKLVQTHMQRDWPEVH